MLEWVPFSSPGHLPHQEIKPTSLTSPALAGGFFTTSTTWEAPVTVCPTGQCPRGHAQLMLGWALLWERKNSFLPTVPAGAERPRGVLTTTCVWLHHWLLQMPPHPRPRVQRHSSPGQPSARLCSSLSMRRSCISVWSSGKSRSSKWAPWHPSHCYSHSDGKTTCMYESRVVIKQN